MAVDLWGGDPLHQQYLAAVQLSPAAVPANTTAEQTFTIPGLAIPPQYVATAFADVNKPTSQPGLGIVGMRVVSATQIAITFSNTTAGAITPTPNETYTALVAW